MKVTIELTAEQAAGLDALCGHEGISQAEAIRRAVDLLIERRERKADRERALQAAAGSWKGHGIDGLDYTQQIRAEWDRDEPEERSASWYDVGVKTAVELTDEQFEWLTRHYERQGMSRAEAVERALATVRDPEPSLELALAATFGIWKDRGIDSLDYERELSEEWERPTSSMARVAGVYGAKPGEIQ